jgi:hypothetical protein
VCKRYNYFGKVASSKREHALMLYPASPLLHEPQECMYECMERHSFVIAPPL